MQVEFVRYLHSSHTHDFSMFDLTFLKVYQQKLC